MYKILKELKLKDMYFLWLKAWKNIFNYSTKATRLEFWSFLSFNTLFLLLVAALFYIKSAYAGGCGELGIKCQNENALTTLILIFYSGVMVFTAPFILLHSSLCSRRLKDIGETIMKGHYRPIITICLLYFILMIIREFIITFFYESILCLIGSVLFICFIYYNLNIFIKAGFYKTK